MEAFVMRIASGGPCHALRIVPTRGAAAVTARKHAELFGCRNYNTLIRAAPSASTCSSSSSSHPGRAAPASPTKSRSLTITPLEVLALPVLKFAGRMVVISCYEDEVQHAGLLRREFFAAHRIVGLDSEAKPALFGRKNRTAIIQLATKDLCVVWRNPQFVNPMVASGPGNKPCSSEFHFPLLAEILESPRITKTAHGAAGEVEQFSREFGIDCRNVVCLFEISHHLQTNPRSLQGLVGIFLRYRLKKDMRCSNWEVENLSRMQLDYAACDAFASCEVLEKLRLENTGSTKMPCKFERVVGLGGGLSMAGSAAESRGGRGGGNRHRSSPRMAVEQNAAQAEATRAGGTDFGESRKDSLNKEAVRVTGGEPLQQLTQLCLSRNLRLKSEGFETSGSGFLAAFSLQGTLYKSKDAHPNIRDAQRDCAQIILAALRKNNE